MLAWSRVWVWQISVRMLSDPSARLNAPLAFATLALISSLRFPVNLLGNLLGQAARKHTRHT